MTEATEEYAGADGFWESELARQAETFGDIAHVWSTYEARVASPDGPPMRGYT